MHDGGQFAGKSSRFDPEGQREQCLLLDVAKRRDPSSSKFSIRLATPAQPGNKGIEALTSCTRPKPTGTCLLPVSSG